MRGADVQSSGKGGLRRRGLLSGRLSGRRRSGVWGVNLLGAGAVVVCAEVGGSRCCRAAASPWWCSQWGPSYWACGSRSWLFLMVGLGVRVILCLNRSMMVIYMWAGPAGFVAPVVLQIIHFHPARRGVHILPGKSIHQGLFPDLLGGQPYTSEHQISPASPRIPFFDLLVLFIWVCAPLNTPNGYFGWLDVLAFVRGRGCGAVVGQPRSGAG